MGTKFGDRDDDDRDRFGGGGAGWQRDARGRKFRDRDGARQYENQNDRDAALEERYRLWCNADPEALCCRSLLQHVMTHTDGLLAEYMQWVRDQMIPHAFDTDHLARWEVERFGDRAYPAAHGALLFAVKCAVFGDPYKRQRAPERQARLTPGLSDEERKDRMLTALDKAAEAMTMPRRGML